MTNYIIGVFIGIIIGATMSVSTTKVKRDIKWVTPPDVVELRKDMTCYWFKSKYPHIENHSHKVCIK